jgi:hypothetical protein
MHISDNVVLPDPATLSRRTFASLMIDSITQDCSNDAVGSSNVVIFMHHLSISIMSIYTYPFMLTSL